MTRAPTQSESDRWDTFFNQIIKRTFPTAHGCLGLGEGAVKLRVFLTDVLKADVPYPIDNADVVVLKDIQNRVVLLNRLIDKVLLKQYAVSFAKGTLDIVALPGTDPESVQGDIYPEEGALGIAPIIVVAAIAAITLLVAGDQAADRLENQAKVEALKLQQQMIKTDQAMATASPDAKSSYDKWKKQNASSFGKAMDKLSGDAKSPGWIERFLGSTPTMALVVGALLIGGALAFSKRKG